MKSFLDYDGATPPKKRRTVKKGKSLILAVRNMKATVEQWRELSEYAAKQAERVAIEDEIASLQEMLKRIG